MSTPVEVVTEFCELVGKKDMGSIRALFADNIVYHNNGAEPAKGIDAAAAALQWQFDNLGDVEFQILHIAAEGDYVLTERIDVVRPGGVYAPVPVMGTFLVTDGKIVQWRDYFDTALTAKLMSGEDTSAVAFTYE